MTDPHTGAEPAGEQRGLSEADLLAQLVQLRGLPTPSDCTWRAATVTLFATSPAGAVGALLHHVQDLDWVVPEHALLDHAFTLLQQRAELYRPTPRSTPGTAKDEST